MGTLQGLIIVTVIAHGIIAGASFDAALVKLPARKHIGRWRMRNLHAGMISATG